MTHCTKERIGAGGAAWTIAMGDNFTFEIERERPRQFGDFGSNADLNGRFPTKAAALDEVIAAFEDTRATLAAAIAHAKRMRRSAKLPTPSPPDL